LYYAGRVVIQLLGVYMGFSVGAPGESPLIFPQKVGEISKDNPEERAEGRINSLVETYEKVSATVGRRGVASSLNFGQHKRDLVTQKTTDATKSLFKRAVG